MKKVKFGGLALAVAVVTVIALSFVPFRSSGQEDKLRKTADKIPGRYIVVLEDWSIGARGDNSIAEAVASELSVVYGGELKGVYKHALSGYVAEMSEKQAEELSKDLRVKLVEEDGWVYANTTQTGATWGLDRIDQRDRPLNGTYTYTPTGSGVNAYIIDTGIRRTHTQFGGRAFAGFDAIGDGQNTNDCNGHGTHVAGTVGSSTYGVAKGVRLYAVRVLNCQGSGSNSGVIAGIDWVTQNHVSPAVANMSLGGGASSALDAAVNNSVASGVTYAVAAGNENQNACNVSPARAANAITVGSTTSSDVRSSFSNYGTCVDIFAPGSSITSTWSTSNSATNTISGTSMASPHVAGVAALYLQGNPGASAATVTNAIEGSASTGKLTSIGTGSPNLLLYSLLSGGPGPTPTPTPTPPPTCGGGTYTGTLSGAGDYEIKPNGTYYQSTSSGVHSATLTGPAGTDFDLRLYRWNGFSWSNVASSLGTTSSESISYNGTAGYYYWRVNSYSGSGSYSLCTGRP